MTDDHSFAATDGGIPMIFRSSRASQHGDTFQPARPAHKVTCAGCDCEPGTHCDTRLRCHYCGHSKTACDAKLSAHSDIDSAPEPCCWRCDHRAT